MSDRRRLHSNGRVAHSSLLGQLEADLFTDGEDAQVVESVTTLWNEPGGRRERELVFGEGFRLLELRDGYVFGYALRDGFAGYIDASTLSDANRFPTHVVKTRMTYGLTSPDFKTSGEHFLLSIGAQVRVSAEEENWAQFAGPNGPLFVPAKHLRRLTDMETDPVAIAERLIGTPYVWGGNSALGIDCSGLVQMACLGCGINCPGDSDMQEAELGQSLIPDASLQRGDLLFWRGHVALVSDPETLIHANAFHMAVAYEPLQDAVKRIEAQGDGPLTARKRLGGPK